MSEGLNPIKAFPSDHKLPLLIRAITGQAVFYAYFYAVSMAPLTLITTIARTDAFWILLLGLLINKERIICIEALGIVVCFSAITAMFWLQPDATEASTEQSGSVTLGMTVGVFSAFLNGTG